MEILQPASDARIETRLAESGKKRQFRIPTPALYAIYAIALAVSITIWLLPIHAPLFLDETGAYWQISAGLSHIWARQYITFPAYSYILWLFSKILGTSETALRIPSFLAMLGAAYLFYRIARELFDRDTAFLATILFCIHPIVIFASTYIRPYAFAVLATNAAILVLLKLRHSQSNRLAALFGFLSASVLWFHYLFGAILPALVLCFFVLKADNRKTMWRQFGIALGAFTLACLPMIPGLRFLFGTAATHASELPPKLNDFIQTFGPGWLPFFVGAFLLALVVALITSRKSDTSSRLEGRQILICLSLALIPILILYGLSAETSIRVFAVRYRLVAVPGIALCWGLIIKRYLFRPIGLLFVAAIVVVTSFIYIGAPNATHPQRTWKYAMAVVEKNAAPDNAPVLISSDYIEAEYAVMPTGSAEIKNSRFFTPLSYYHLSVPVVGLPITLDKQAIRIGSQFLAKATSKRQRFLAVQNEQLGSYQLLDWLKKQASASYSVRNLGIYDKIEILEFDPRTPATPPAAHASDQPPQPSAKVASRPATP